MAEVSINNKIWGIKGAIGRREYILNTTYLGAFGTLLSLPFSLWLFINYFNDLQKFATMTYTQTVIAAPWLVKVLLLIDYLIIIPVAFSLDVRRLNDIFGKDSYFLSYLISTGLVVILFWALLTNNYLLLYSLVIIEFITLWVIKGKETGKLPKDEVKRFNWGAFWGTWIWGLINKSYKTLWAIPAFILFPIFPYVQIICGIKGNEWAYEKAKNKELPVFHKGQKHQAIFWNIFSGVLVVILPLLTVIITAMGIIGYAAANPEKIEQAVQEYATMIEEKIDENFDKYEIGNDLNKFYIDPETWTGMDFDDRFTIYNQAVNFAYTQKRSANNDIRIDNERNITKIYSSYNNELLAEFNPDEVDETDVKTVIESSKKAFHVNENPKLP